MCNVGAASQLVNDLSGAVGMGGKGKRNQDAVGSFVTDFSGAVAMGGKGKGFQQGAAEMGIAVFLERGNAQLQKRRIRSEHAVADRDFTARALHRRRRRQSAATQ